MKNLTRNLFFASTMFALVSCGAEQPKSSVAEAQPEESVITEFLNNRFGMFIHFNMGTFHGEGWANPFHDPKSFNPTELDCGQWADAAKAAKMQYAVFTTKHHDGFCLWDTAVTNYDIASSPYNGDIVKEYVDAFRERGIKTGLYFSVWDRHHYIAKNRVTPKDIEYTKTQLTELLTNYGEILCLVIDGWGSVWGQSPTFKDIPFEVLADHIHSIQPNCLVINHSCMTDRAYTQVVHYEATHGQHCPYDNTIPSQQGPTMQPSWFWEKGFEDLDLKPLADIVSELKFCNSHCSNYLLNAAPNDRGLMDQNIVDRLREVGEAIDALPAPMSKLPEEQKPHANVKATASVNGANVPELVLDANLFTYWEPAKGEKNPTITLDFGKPETFNKVVCGEANGSNVISDYIIEAMVDGAWTKITDAKEMGVVKGDKQIFQRCMSFHKEYQFEDITAQQFRLRVLETLNSRPAKIAEITFVKYE